MNLIQSVKQLFSPTEGQREFFDKTISFLGDNQAFFKEANDENYITEGYQKNEAIYSIINLITRNATMIPFKVYEVKNKSLAKDYTALTSGMSTKGAMMKAQVLKSRSFNEVTQSEILDVLQNPNPSESWSSFLTNYIAFGKLTGNRYIYGVRDGAGKVREMYVLPSQHIQIISGGQFEPIKGYTVQAFKDATIDFTREEILHVKDFNPDFNFSGSHLYGQSPLRAGWRTLENNNQVIETSKKQLQNQSARGLLVAKEMDGISRGQAKQLDLALQRKMKQANGSVAITNQPMEWINFGLSAADMELINQYNVTMKGLCNLYGIPVSLMNNTEASSYNNIKEAKSFLFQNAVNPEMIKLRDELNRWLVPMFGEDLYLDFDFTVIPELQEDISEMVAQMDKAWYVTGNEKRQVLQYPEDNENPQMNEYFVPVNLMPMKNMDLQTLASLDAAARENLLSPEKEEPKKED